MENHHFHHMASQIRERYIPVSRIMEIVSPKVGDTILDIGAGDGFYSLQFAKAGSKVIAMDVSKESAETIRKIAKSEHMPIEVMNLDVCRSFDPPPFNKAFFSTSFHDIECRVDLVGRITRAALKPTEITLIEFKKIESPGPPMSIRMSKEDLDRIFFGAGYKLAETIDLEIHYVNRYIHE